MSEEVLFGPDETGLVDRDQIKLLVWLDGEDATVAGPVVTDTEWVVRAIRAVTREWPVQEQQQPRRYPVGNDYLDCTAKELAVIIYNHHNVIAERGEVFSGSGLASHYIDVAGYRRHETDWAISSLSDLADDIEQQKGYLYEL